jgi:prepilin-type N-terminal cleavage/methylation domain-containing protein/prepilin-type processing-associated H-X9-DG protein
MKPLRRAFTLVELLVVIAIIAILAALLLPVLARAKERGRVARCKSNGHQMGLALNLYVQDEGFYPMLGFKTPQGKVSMWFDQLSPHLAKAKWGQGVYQCPSYKWGLSIPLSSSTESIAGSYAYNAWGFNPTDNNYGIPLGGLGGASDTPSPYVSPVQESAIKVPSDMYALGDSPILFQVNAFTRLQGGLDYFLPGSSMASVDIGSPYARQKSIVSHSRGYNMTFLDAHVEFVPEEKLFSAEPPYWRRWNRFHWALGDAPPL